jgi:hypothetical protein
MQLKNGAIVLRAGTAHEGRWAASNATSFLGPQVGCASRCFKIAASTCASSWLG